MGKIVSKLKVEAYRGVGVSRYTEYRRADGIIVRQFLILRIAILTARVAAAAAADATDDDDDAVC